MYTTYDFYKDTYLGTSIKEENFNSFCYRASEYLDYYTFNRINDGILLQYSTQIQSVCCAIADFLNDVEQYNSNSLSNSDSKAISSKTVGSISVSYMTTKSYMESYMTDTSKIDSHIYDLLSKYLIGTSLLYNGIDKVHFKR